MPPIRLLIVDDAMSQRMLLVAKLSQYDEVEVISEAKDGQEAIEKFESLNPDVVILDLVMPKVDGKEALKKIMQIDSNANVIIASSLGGEDDLEECLRMGAKSFVQKPYDEEHLIREIKKING
ncbi:MAG: response regulator [Gammaproteobacteria bacterium]|nr:response regulator [Gammaproteobacteria bacterium]